jgi:hypothetical protein
MRFETRRNVLYYSGLLSLLRTWPGRKWIGNLSAGRLVTVLPLQNRPNLLPGNDVSRAAPMCAGERVQVIDGHSVHNGGLLNGNLKGSGPVALLRTPIVLSEVQKRERGGLVHTFAFHFYLVLNPRLIEEGHPTALHRHANSLSDSFASCSPAGRSCPGHSARVFRLADYGHRSQKELSLLIT